MHMSIIGEIPMSKNKFDNIILSFSVLHTGMRRRIKKIERSDNTIWGNSDRLVRVLHILAEACR